MEFSINQYREIRRHLDDHLQEAGLGSVLEEAAIRTHEDIVSPQTARAQTISYFRNVLNALRKRSRHTYDSALEIGRNFITTETGEPLTGFSLVATPEDSQFFGFDEIPLNEAPDLAELTQSLQNVINDLETE